LKYLDTNIIAYAIENHPKYGERCKKILEDIESEKAEGLLLGAGPGAADKRPEETEQSAVWNGKKGARNRR
jgi:hypothetical protein